MKEIDFLQQYIGAATDSTNRTRQILLVMIIASILMFAAFWNSRPAGWVNSRLALAKATHDILKNEADRKEADRKKEPSVGVLEAPLHEADQYSRAKKFANEFPSKTLKQAEDNLFWSQKIRTEQLSQIQVPFLGISFDVNDLGMLGGFTFIVLLIWVNYSIWHQSNNLELAFNFARKLEKKGETALLYHTYQSLAARQVLTIPPRPTSIKPSKPDKLKSWIRKGSKLLYALPLVVQTTVVANDWATYDVGMLINSYATKIVLTTGSVFWVLIVTLTIMCFYMWRKTYNTWQRAANDI